MLILLDQDGVLADFEHGIAHGWQTRYGTPVPLPQPRQNFYVRDDAAPEHRDALIDLYSAAGFFAGMRPPPGAIRRKHRRRRNGLSGRHGVRVRRRSGRETMVAAAVKARAVRKTFARPWRTRLSTLPGLTSEPAR